MCGEREGTKSAVFISRGRFPPDKKQEKKQQGPKDTKLKYYNVR